jgi:hypothetical protein
MCSVTEQPVQPTNAVESVLNNVPAPSTNCATIDRSKELPVNGEGSFLDCNKSLEVIDNSLEVRVLSSEFEFDPFSDDVLPDPRPGTRNG